ncbi:FkbM family methyltransferase [Paeniroseomonas aquatica]|uniref:FkbM family methyltransferase n=1 Tax=Paeniroseomonas aquatica TaxID=373043 RepID=UPI0036179669
MNDDIGFIAYCLARRRHSKSQIMQDLWVCFELNEKRKASSLNLAQRMEKNSNTWLLEKKFEWKGILAEPNPIWHQELINNRKCFIEKKCISSKSGDIVSFVTTNDTDPELSGIEQFSDADHFAETRRQGHRVRLETISLDDLLEKYNAPSAIDYMSIDTEGSELDILSSYSFKHRFKAISVENNKNNEKALDELMVSKGYVRVFRLFSQWDSWYVSSELRKEEEFTIAAPNS